MCDLRSKFKQWEDWLLGDDVHSIRKQIHNMTWNSAVFLSINEVRKYAAIDKEGEPKLNPMVHRFINYCFFQTQAMAIRRLLDKRSDVVSLYNLINDMDNNCELLSRENILTIHGYPYDYEAEEKRLFHRELRVKNGDVFAEGHLKCAHSECIHKSIDAMLNTDAERRKPSDKIPKGIFEWLKQRCDRCKEIPNYVNKFFAHSATPESRASIKADDIKITLGHILDAHKIICETAEFIGINILYQSFGNFLAVPQYAQFEHFDKPWATKETVRKLYKFWRSYDDDMNKWTQWDWQDELKKERE